MVVGDYISVGCVYDAGAFARAGLTAAEKALYRRRSADADNAWTSDSTLPSIDTTVCELPDAVSLLSVCDWLDEEAAAVLLSFVPKTMKSDVAVLSTSDSTTQSITVTAL